MADRLLKAQLGVSLHRIQIYPTNEYTPAVHRLLQVSANLYDATTNRGGTDFPYLPSVFRPVFTNEGGRIYISGYAEEVGTNVLGVPLRGLGDAAERAALQPFDMVSGVPIIIGARKGFPNFNQVAMQPAISVQRRLEFRRPMISAAVNETNQMYIVGISNVLGVEAWNSYTNAFPRELQLIVAMDVTSVLTNEAGLVLVSNQFAATSATNIPALSWTGYFQPGAFKIPFETNLAVLPPASYRQSDQQFVSLTNVFERGAGFPVPQWWLRVGMRLRFAIVDVAAARLVDYVNLSAAGDPVSVVDILKQGADCEVPSFDSASQWCTNRLQNSSSLSAATYGIWNQINHGLGLFNVDWNSFSLDPTVGTDYQKAIDSFRVNLNLFPRYFPGTQYYKSNIFYAPLVPQRRIYQHLTWEANDPMVHHLLSDLTNLKQTNNIDFVSSYSAPLPNLGSRNQRYAPWQPLAGMPDPVTLYNLAVKDPLVRGSDDWSFPENQGFSADKFRSIHRGTPWQTLYLKSEGVDVNVWRGWCGISDEQQAALVAPTNDWRLVSQLHSIFNTNTPRALLSINEQNASAWQGVLGGIAVLTNTISEGEWLNDPFRMPQFEEATIESNSAQASVVATAINQARGNQLGDCFQHIGDLLSVSNLSVASPWLNRGSMNQRQGISDEAYERIPAQLLARVRPDSIGQISASRSTLQIQFTGFDDYPYAVQVSSNLVDWISVRTNYPTNNSLVFTDRAVSGRPGRFYRSVLAR